jgi:imidazole glycerol-phosphate synthase subunit HisH
MPEAALMSIAVIDYGVGNLRSVVNACERRAGTVKRVSTGAELIAAAPKRIVLPGVGAIGAALELLRRKGFEEALDHLVIKGEARLFGICVGMQVMAESCEEFGSHRGFGWIAGSVRPFDASAGLRVPHVGWNSVVARQGSFMQPASGEDFYFLHSCRFEGAGEAAAASADYGGEFVCAVEKGRIQGVQFHPEKSARPGLDLLGRFLAEP